MVDLNKPIQAREDKGLDFTPAPEGDYILRVLEISPWKKEVKTVKVIQRDEKGKAIKDAKGNNVTETVANCEIYNSNVSLEIVGGEHEGKRVFHNLTTHPNAPFSISAFLYGLGIESMSASEIPTKCKDKLCAAKVGIDTYDKIVVNKDTGLEETQTRESNKVRNFKQLPDDFSNTQEPNDEEVDGI